MNPKTNEKPQLTVNQVTNGYIVTYSPQVNRVQQVSEALGAFQLPTQEWGVEISNKWFEGLISGISSQVKQMEPVTLVYRSEDYERMVDDISSFLLTNIPPAAPDKTKPE